LSIILDTYRDSENFIKRGVVGQVDFDGVLNFAKRWVSAVLDNEFSAFDGVSATLTKKM